MVCRSSRELLGCEGAAFVLREDGRGRYLDEDSACALWKGRSFDLDACRAACIDRVLCKPIGRSELAAALGVATA